MGKHRKWVQMAIFVIVVLVGGWTLFTNVFFNEEKPKVGSKAPNFKLMSLDGQTRQLSDYAGKVVVVNFWGTFCEPCRNEMPALERQNVKWAGKNVQILGLNLDEPRVAVENFIQQVNTKFPILFDKNEEMRKIYGVSQYPTTFFIKPDGKVGVIRIGEMDEKFIEDTIKAMVER